jgi:hypothetical protein
MSDDDDADRLLAEAVDQGQLDLFAFAASLPRGLPVDDTRRRLAEDDQAPDPMTALAALLGSVACRVDLLAAEQEPHDQLVALLQANLAATNRLAQMVTGLRAKSKRASGML